MTPLTRAHTALALLAIDPSLGGLVLRARSGAVRDAVTNILPDHTRLHPALSADALDGGIDVSATLNSGTLTLTKGLLVRQGVFVLAMAERTEPYIAARLAATLDAQNGQYLIALDEGIDEEQLPPALSDRLAFHVDLGHCAISEIIGTPVWPHARRQVAVKTPPDTVETLVLLAVRLGITSLRAVGFALRTTKAHASLHGRTETEEEDIAAAVALVFAHRATQLPAEDDPQEIPDDTPPNDDPNTQPEPQTSLPQDILLDAVLASLPPDLLAKLNTGGTTRGATGSGAGKKKIGNRRGRPLPARDGGAAQGRVDLIATLRAAIPWQTLRRQNTPDRAGPIIRPSDLRRKRYVEHSDRLLIFSVDASGSAAMARLGEAKGAIELLLAEAYARRDHVALIAFRGAGADVLLDPTRSLVQTKRKLAALPGGGATPLAAGLMAAQNMAMQARRKGLSPTVITLTDGRANMALDGTPNRAQATSDARTAAQALRAAGVDCIVIDTGRRPEQSLAALAGILGGPYIALPRADARSLSDAVTRQLED
ncbi:magnesium chelatase subunit D [Sulfitobacter guttiformis]|uniref:Magnesium chelatase subunit D n=1 Tax=Sulfitobacter guttiformis TaxID=74349 RepID=J7G551_9RHOB|nr:magnesium chelatase subunit D [Sulfitobacter guttiformis]AFP55511.1 Mg-protoporphyrin IX chelatase BchD; 60 kDa subunit [Sulfitobacter guttiformis]KIN75472.1 Mg-protoporphyrin IX chelatase BchD 60 kDa subunit [Sulfitobacter guttiformis KCTC 32187]RKE92134.1 magnesium chelatase subunit D [Sulfitobacter guttiformis]